MFPVVVVSSSAITLAALRVCDVQIGEKDDAYKNNNLITTTLSLSSLARIEFEIDDDLFNTLISLIILSSVTPSSSIR